MLVGPCMMGPFNYSFLGFWTPQQPENHQKPGIYFAILLMKMGGKPKNQIRFWLLNRL